jgi:hypothetical protein
MAHLPVMLLRQFFYTLDDLVVSLRVPRKICSGCLLA